MVNGLLPALAVYRSYLQYTSTFAKKRRKMLNKKCKQQQRSRGFSSLFFFFLFFYMPPAPSSILCDPFSFCFRFYLHFIMTPSSLQNFQLFFEAAKLIAYGGNLCSRESPLSEREEIAIFLQSLSFELISI